MSVVMKIAVFWDGRTDSLQLLDSENGDRKPN
jgi:hypothetical protein